LVDNSTERWSESDKGQEIINNFISSREHKERRKRYPEAEREKYLGDKYAISPFYQLLLHLIVRIYILLVN
jgi:hypothetical protein